MNVSLDDKSDGQQDETVVKIELHENDERIKEVLSSDKVTLPPYQRNLSNYLMYHYIKDLKNKESENKGFHENDERMKEFLETEAVNNDMSFSSDEVPLPTYLRNLSNYIKVWNN